MSTSDRAIYQLHEVFVKSGSPTITYVEPEDAIFLKLALTQPVRAVIVEGPPGTGKTVTIERIINNSIKNAQNQSLHREIILQPSKAQDLQDIQTIRDWHTGTVVIDSFHNLDVALRADLTQYLIDLINATNVEKKLVIIGTPLMYQTLLDIPAQFAAKIDFYRFRRANKELVHGIIEKGEQALNIFFEDKEKIIQLTYGDPNLAQRLCHDLCAMANVTQTQEHTKSIPFQITYPIKGVMTYLEYPFAKIIKSFISCGDTDNTICWHILEKLARSEDGSLSFSHFKENEPSHTHEIDQFMYECWMDSFYAKHPQALNYFFFAKSQQKLIINDPRLSFYLKHSDLRTLALEVGKTPKRPQVFISYSHLDKDCMERLLICLKPIERELLIDSWVDSKIEGGQDWQAEIDKALHAAKAAVLLISAPFWASDFISTYELPTLLASAKTRGTKIIPVILSPSDFDHTAWQQFQAINTPSDPVRGSGKTPSDWDAVFVKLANALREYFRLA
jgi:TIR domain